MLLSPMILMIGLLCLFPAVTLAFSWRAGHRRGEFWRVLALFALAMAVASPFLTDRGLGTGDSVNYSNSVADSVTQLRAGVLPVYVGQSEYAFNGRVHPLRTAPYFTYGTGLLDVVVRHRLTFWELQNLLMAASLVGAAFSAYLCLGKLGTVGPWTALLLAGAYLLSPGLLTAAYGQDLYMTVNTAPYVPIVMLALARTFDDRTLANVATLATGLALCWLAHPPVAAWLSLGCAMVLLIGFFAHAPRWRDLAVVPAGALMFVILSGYGFVSSTTIDPRLISARYDRAPPEVVSKVMLMTHRFWGASLLPVSESGRSLGDFQLGYALWLLLILAGVMAARRRSPRVVWALGAMTLFYFVATTPVPWLHRVLWEYVPMSVVTMTNMWPMQRIYLLLSAAVVFMAALAWPKFNHPPPRAARWMIPILIAAAVGWTGWQAWHFINHGFTVRHSPERTAAVHRPENVDITIDAYAFLGYPSWFSPGPMDPEQSLHLLSPRDLSVIVSNAAAGRVQPPMAKGRLRVIPGKGGTVSYLEPTLTIAPGKEYALRFRFLTAPIDGSLRLAGETLSRTYILPSYLGPKGFGMGPGNNPEITLFTTSPRPEQVKLMVSSATAGGAPWTEFADFTLEEVNRAALPLQLIRLVPFFECRFDAPEACWLETPRMYIAGYAATVDGRAAPVADSLESMVMVAVPAGKHTVQLRYVGSPLLHRAFFLALWGWVAVVTGLAAKVIFWRP